ncbi:DegT/DnrJ/EryC1/StrS family aminotransferase [Hydrogenovibrio marinus]|uniref:DegT/DnrJ/EryC1/StrS family aminotransferase n=1 Tax=Hydrogenovibrio marinus TaxID=28885 RepID=UPI001E426BB9|nr:DegT/DnrJ/EryC1/StrS family aminotransferase [Hydrogenovibrio marinus]
MAAIQKVVDSNMFTMGKYVAEYEKLFADYFGSKYAVMVSSGSTANLLMVAALFYTQNEKYKLQRGDEVIVPAVSWSTTYYPLYQYGLKIKFVDIDPQTLNMDLNQLELAITDKTKAILAVNLLGNPNDFSKIHEVIGDRDILLLEDNCESMGASLQGQQAGTFGLMGTYSSFFSHHIATMEGGCIVTDDEELYHILLCIRAHGWTRNLPKENLVSGTKSDDPFEEAFKFVLPGYNARPLEMSGAIGIEQLKKLPSFIKNRQENGAYFTELFLDHPYLQIQQEIGKSSWFGFSLVIKDGSEVNRSQIVSKLMEGGVECRPIVSGNFAKNEVVKYFDYEIHDSLDNAEYIDVNGFFVGNHQFDIKNKISDLRKLLG